MIKVIFFDLDDTLADTSRLAEMARKNAIENMIRHGLPVDFDTAYSELMELIKEYGSNFPHHFDYLLRRLDIPYDPKLVAAGVIAYHNTKFAYLREVPGARRVLIRLRELGYRLGIITDGNPIKQWEKILRLEMDDFFEHVIISDFEGVKKPHPKIFRKALKAFNVKPNEAMMVGDRLYSDIYGAKNVGMKTVWFKYGKYSDRELEYRKYADYEITKLQQLLEVLELENSSDKEVHST
ncbi:TIGR02253 family HAD-type hydrolase [Pyrococcus kukulkanii]|uniref:Glyceraldehyde 3-phosphate phosphatase n=1 Tax=Pyrococcus kukulkanii TaxID=1609559 RepID=A0A127BB01_9EURY|nr:TIGR02253 family HAD-type hydrolase [Pyrococcus kukulkanii]AMM54521.1 haloacid dehalogenase [Pyrococcus kukulkanii]